MATAAVRMLPQPCSELCPEYAKSACIQNISAYRQASFFTSSKKFIRIKPQKSRSRHARAVLAGASVRDQANLNASLRSESVPDPLVADLLLTLQSSLSEASRETSPATERANFLLDTLRTDSSNIAERKKWPSRRQEEFRFTDMSALRSLRVVKAPQPATEGTTVNGGEGRVDVPDGVIVGGLQSLSDETLERFVAPFLGLSGESDIFSALNGASCPDVLVIAVPAGVKVAEPIKLLHISSAGSAREGEVLVSSPRVLVVVEEEGEVDLVEEFEGVNGEGGGSYWANSVVEVVMKKGAKAVHTYIQDEVRGSFHTRRTFVQQAEGSRYELVEAELGGRISRHLLQMKQVGPNTETVVSTFALAGARQLHDLHSSLVLDHPRGITRQLHKCIVTDASAHSIFDGNVKVNRLAQQTDAQQLSRSLLLAARGTVNVKPNLQIIADDVKCTHGAAISDLEEEQLFYFQARGINAQTARSALVFSFGAEVVEKIPHRSLRQKIEKSVKTALSKQGAMDSSVADKLSGGDE